METDPLLILSERKLLKQADKLIVLADSSKIGKRSSLILCMQEEVDVLITDDEVTEERLDMLKKHSVEIILAPLQPAE